MIRITGLESLDLQTVETEKNKVLRVGGQLVDTTYLSRDTYREFKTL